MRRQKEQKAPRPAGTTVCSCCAHDLIDDFAPSPNLNRLDSESLGGGQVRLLSTFMCLYTPLATLETSATTAGVEAVVQFMESFAEQLQADARISDFELPQDPHFALIPFSGPNGVGNDDLGGDFEDEPYVLRWKEPISMTIQVPSKNQANTFSAVFPETYYVRWNGLVGIVSWDAEAPGAEHFGAG